MTREVIALLSFGFFLTAAATTAIVLTVVLGGNALSGSETALLVDRLERVEEVLNTHDSRRNAQYGELKRLIGGQNEETN